MRAEGYTKVAGQPSHGGPNEIHCSPRCYTTAYFTRNARAYHAAIIIEIMKTLTVLCKPCTSERKALKSTLSARCGDVSRIGCAIGRNIRAVYSTYSSIYIKFIFNANNPISALGAFPYVSANIYYD